MVVLGIDDQPTDATQAPIDDQPTNTTITLEITGVRPDIADVIPEDSIDADYVIAAENKSVRATEVIVTDHNGDDYHAPPRLPGQFHGRARIHRLLRD